MGYERQLSERHAIRTSVGVKIPSSSESFGTINPLPLISKGKVGLQLDLFAGIGGQYRDEEITIFKEKKGTCSVTGTYYEFQDYDPPEIENSKNWHPTLHAGILFGLDF